jgi:Dual specificity phosphatase, catalytic domain
MSGGLKVTFVDNSATQYNTSADEVEQEGPLAALGWKGRLFIGDRDAASFLQLKHRNVTHVINCEKDIHGVSKEDFVKYLKIDPESDEGKCFELSYLFLERELSEKSSVVLVHCQSGNGRSCGIVLYYLMRKLNLSLANAHRALRRLRPKIHPRGNLVTLLLKEEKRLRRIESVELNERREIVYIDGGDALFDGLGGGKKAGMKGSSQKGAKKTGGGGAVWAVFVVAAIFLLLYFGLDLFIKSSATTTTNYSSGGRKGTRSGGSAGGNARQSQGKGGSSSSRSRSR